MHFWEMLKTFKNKICNLKLTKILNFDFFLLFVSFVYLVFLTNTFEIFINMTLYFFFGYNTLLLILIENYFYNRFTFSNKSSM